MNSHVPKLTDDELTAYEATFETIHSEFLKMKGIREDLDRLNLVKWEKPNPKVFDSVTTADGQNWKAYALLLPLPKARVLLCRQTGEWAVIQQLDSKGLYSQANGSTEILLKGNDVRELVTEYTAQAEHTLKFMARNLVAQAQRVAWNQFPDRNPSVVVQAISERCLQLVEKSQTLKQSETETVRQSRGIKI